MISMEYKSCISFNPNYAFLFTSCTNKFSFESNFKSHSNRKQTFEITKQSKSKIKNCFTWLLLISNKKTVYSKKENKKFHFKLSFITLTLPEKQKHHDNYIKAHMLEPFLYWMKKYNYAQSYVWKAEAQKNGNIHFHITTNKFIHWKSIRAKWNKICAKHGYCKVFQDGTNDHGNASTQIKAVLKDKQLAKYMIKYFSKNETDRRPIEGRLWAASTNLNVKNFLVDDLSSTYEPLLSSLSGNSFIQWLQLDYGQLFTWSKPIFKHLPITVRHHFQNKIKEMHVNDIPQRFIEIESFS